MSRMACGSGVRFLYIPSVRGSDCRCFRSSKCFFILKFLYFHSQCFFTLSFAVVPCFIFTFFVFFFSYDDAVPAYHRPTVIILPSSVRCKAYTPLNRVYPLCIFVGFVRSL